MTTHVRDESGLKSALLKQMKVQLPGYVALRHEDVRTAGIPDLSVTAHGRTTWWEFKHGTPDFDSTGIQELTMLRLDAAGYAARYVIWQEHKDVKVTLIVRPRYLKEMIAEARCVGFDHRFVIDFMRKVHQP